MLSSEVNVRSDCKSPSTMGVQSRKRKQVVSLSLSVPASKRLFLNPTNDDDLEAFSEVNAPSESVLYVSSEADLREQCLHQGRLSESVIVHRRLSDSSVDSRGSLSADSGVEIDSTIGGNGSPCTPVSCTKLIKQNSTYLKRTQPACKFQAELVQDEGYVRRLASLNAQACVSALFASKPKMQLKCLNSDYSMDSALKNLHETTEQKCIQEGKSFCEHELITDSFDDKHEDGHQTIQKSWSAWDTNACGCLQSLMTNPPAVVPIGMKNVVEIVELLKATACTPSIKPKRGDNRWSCYGDPIRELRYHHPETNDCTVRKYYIGIKRKQEEIFVRDCILVKGSSAKKPYIAKVASFWQEKGGLMMTLFWYYRPDDVQDLCITDFIEGELLASEHHDENTVACIEEKCYVVGFAQYCRFIAGRKRDEDSLGFPGASFILPKTTEDTSVKGHWLPATDTDPSLVFLCRRGYNHLTGRLFRSTPSK